MRGTSILAGICAGLAIVAAAAGPFEGKYLLRSAVEAGYLSCDTVDAWMFLTIADDFIRDGEVGCQLRNPVAVRDMAAILYDAECGAEGQVSRHRLMLVARPDGIGIASEDWFDDYVRCP